ncbi:MAG: hypothetical protein HFJ51_07345 [Clostridia bacterium]|nr:hypothetical protein [Clostridia bacterium]
MKEANISINRSDIKHLNQALKRLEVEGIESVKIAKGDISINTFKRIYLIA